jgi:hypothetical protein
MGDFSSSMSDVWYSESELCSQKEASKAQTEGQSLGDEVCSSVGKTSLRVMPLAQR